MNVMSEPSRGRIVQRDINWTRRRLVRPLARLSYGVTAAALIVVAAGCGTADGDRGSSPAAPTPATSSSPSGDPSGSAPASTERLTDQEMTWIQSATNLAERILIAVPAGDNLTAQAAKTQAAALRKCSTDLTAIGDAPTQRLKPAQEQFKSGCAMYDKVAGCYETIGKYGDNVTEAQYREITEAADCITAATAEGAEKLKIGIERCNEIKQQTMPS